MDIKDELERAVRVVDADGQYHYAAIALALRYPQSNALSKLSSKFELGKVWVSNWVIAAYVLGAHVDGARFLEFLSEVLAETRGGVWGFLSDVGSAYVRRLSSDDQFYNDVISVLGQTDDVNLKASLPKLLSMARGTSSELISIGENELKRQRQCVVPEVGFDIMAERPRSISQCFLDVLMPVNLTFAA